MKKGEINELVLECNMKRVSEYAYRINANDYARDVLVNVLYELHELGEPCEDDRKKD